MANGKPSYGDATGRQKAEASKAARQEEQERSAQMTMASEAQTYEEQVGVFDAQSGLRIDEPAPSTILQDVEEANSPGFPQQPDYDPEPVLTGKESDEELAPILAQRAEFERPRAPRGTVQSAQVKVRVNQDVDKMTYGMRNGEPNNYNFKEGLTYQLPRDVAEHLSERGLVGQWF